MGWFSSSKTAESEKLDEEVKVIQKNHELEGEIKEAVAQRNFEKAAKVQTELNELRKEPEEANNEKPVETKLSSEYQVDWSAIIEKGSARALGSGGAGATAMVIQVCSLMWMRTIMNYQYRYGTTTKIAAQTLWKEGGIRRFYRGVLPALFQGPLSRFGDTAANTGMLTLLNSMDSTKDLSVGIKTVAASASAAAFRIFLMPIDTV